MRPCSRLVVSAVVLSLVGALPARTGVQTKRPLSFLDIIDLPLVQDPQLSPDGKQIAFVIIKPDWKGNRPVGHIYRINADGTNQIQLTFGDRGESSPRWSPDGRALAFSARRDSDTSNQIYLLDSDGGEARRVTTHPAAPGDMSWAPDGKSIFFTATDVKNAEERERDRVQDDVYAFEETNFKQRHLWMTDLQGKTKRLTDGAFSVGTYELSADAKKVVMFRTPSPLFEHNALGEVWVMNADGSNAVQLTRNTVGEEDMSLSPDGTMVVFTASANKTFEPYYNDKIFVVPAAGGDARMVLPADAAYEVEDVTWSADGTSLYFLANMGVHNELMRLSVASGDVSVLTFDDHTIGNWSYADALDRHVFTRNTTTRPSEIYTLPGNAGEEPRRVTNVFQFVDREFTLARQQRISWRGQDGTQIEGLLYYPLDYKPGQRYPLIVYTHGGPQTSDKFGFGSEMQVYAAKGYAVLRPNYRGSTGYGDAFLRDMVNGYFKQSHLDVLAGVDAVIAMGVADANKLVKMGWSAGGHMTNKLITVTDRFKAASSGAGVANWVSLFSQSDTRLGRIPWFGGTPYEANAPIDMYWDHSPLKDAAKIKTPTLFLVGENDPRVPLPQSVEMYRALKHNNVPTKLYVAPREGHGWGELRHRLFKYQVEMEWFEKWVNNRTYTWERAPGDEKKDPPKPTTAQ